MEIRYDKKNLKLVRHIALDNNDDKNIDKINCTDYLKNTSYFHDKFNQDLEEKKFSPSI